MVRVDRNGRETKLAEIRGTLLGLRLSPAADRVAAFKQNDGSRTADLWMYGYPSGTPTRLTSTGDAVFPLFSPDGQSVTFTKEGGTNPGLYSLALNANSTPQRIMEDESGAIYSASWSPDGTQLAYLRFVNVIGQIFVRPTQALVPDSKADSGEPNQFAPSTFSQQDPHFSPDGRWMVYVSNESGADEIYVQPYPGPGEKHRISVDGGRNPAWSRDGRELFYQRLEQGESPSVSMMAVAISTTGAFKVGVPRQLFERINIPSIRLRSYDVTPDGQFIMAMRGTPPDQRVTKLNVVLGWAEELKRRVPISSVPAAATPLPEPAIPATAQ